MFENDFHKITVTGSRYRFDFKRLFRTSHVYNVIAGKSRYTVKSVEFFNALYN